MSYLPVLAETSIIEYCQSRDSLYLGGRLLDGVVLGWLVFSFII